MPPPGKALRPIIVIKKKAAHGAHHGGAWKVAYADFVTAMMSLFIVLWLLNTSPQIKKAVAGYFNDPAGSGRETGTKSPGADESISIDQKNVVDLKKEIEKAILKQSDLTKLSKQIEITVTGEGLKIDLIEDKGGTFFDSGSAKLSNNGVKLLSLLSAQLKSLPNRVLIEGHTDAQPFSSDNGYTNWELSSDRANSARRVLQQDGLGQGKISQIRGYADQSLRVPANPLDPSNRRISLIVQWLDATSPDVPKSAAGSATAAPAALDAPAAGSATTPDSAKKPDVILPEEPPAATPKVSTQPETAAPQSGWVSHVSGLLPSRKK
jgi:chemotaxis protein MotB